MQFTRTTFTMTPWKNGNPAGGPVQYDTAEQAEAYLNVWPGTPVRRIAWNERVPDSEKDGMIIEEIRTLHREGLPLAGVRIYA